MEQRLPARVATALSVIGLLVAAILVATPADAAVPSGSISGVVNLGSSSVTAGAGVVQVTVTETYPDAGTTYITQTDASGHYSFPISASNSYWTVYFHYQGTPAGAFADMWSGNVPVGANASQREAVYYPESSADVVNMVLPAPVRRFGEVSILGRAVGAGQATVQYERLDASGVWSAPVTGASVDAQGNYSMTLVAGYYRFMPIYTGPQAVKTWASWDSMYGEVVISDLTETFDYQLKQTASGNVLLSGVAKNRLQVTADYYLPSPFTCGTSENEPDLSGGSWQSSGLSSVTDSSGNFTLSGLDAKAYRFTFTSLDNPAITESVVRCTYGVGDIAVNLTPTAKITGYVDLYRQVPVNVGLLDSTGELIATTVSTNGVFSFANEPVGAYSLIYRYDPLTDAQNYDAIQTISLAGEDYVFPEERMPTKVQIEGYISPQDSSVSNGGISGFDVYAIRVDPVTNATLQVTHAVTDRGTFGFVGLSHGTYWILASDPTHQFASTEYNSESPYYQPDFIQAPVDGDHPDIDFEMPVANSISGTVTGVSAADLAAGDVTAEVEVFDYSLNGWSPTGDLWPVDAAGSYNIGDLPPDSYRIKISDDGMHGHAQATTPTIMVENGETSAGHDVTLPPPDGQLPSGSPRGSVDTAIARLGTLTVAGWALDPDTFDSIPVQFYLDGVFQGQGQADQIRTDIGTAFPSYGPEHGYSITLVGLSGGRHTVCAYGINAGPSAANTTLGCRTVSVTAANPVGSLESVTSSGLGSVSVSGWALDADATAPLAVHVYVDGAFDRVISATGERADVGAAYPGTGTTHGYSTTLTGLAGGKHSVCTYGINQNSGTSNTLLGCRTISVPGGSPIGSLDSATVTSLGTVSIAGWAVDGDTTASISVHAYVDGVFGTQLTADGVRPDIAGAFPGYGSAHGFSSTLSGLTGGAHTICLYGVNQLAGSNSTLGCKTVTVPTGSPFGSVDSVTGSSSGIAVSGWALDPDVAASIDVHVYVDGVFNSVVTASGSRPDIASAFPGYGAAHGFSTTVAAVAGSHTVCVYGINQGATANNSMIGGRCWPVVIPAN